MQEDPVKSKSTNFFTRFIPPVLTITAIMLVSLLMIYLTLKDCSVGNGGPNFLCSSKISSHPTPLYIALAEIPGVILLWPLAVQRKSRPARSFILGALLIAIAIYALAALT